MQNVIDKIELTFAALDGFLGWFFGDLDGFLYALIIFVVMDYFTGILAAGVKKELSSAVGFKGIAKKVCIFVLVGIANILDTQVLQNGTAISSIWRMRESAFWKIPQRSESLSLQNCGICSSSFPMKRSCRVRMKSRKMTTKLRSK